MSRTSLHNSRNDRDESQVNRQFTWPVVCNQFGRKEERAYFTCLCEFVDFHITPERSFLRSGGLPAKTNIRLSSLNLASAEESPEKQVAGSSRDLVRQCFKERQNLGALSFSHNAAVIIQKEQSLLSSVKLNEDEEEGDGDDDDDDAGRSK